MKNVLQTIVALLTTLVISCSSNYTALPKYKRSDWPHWSMSSEKCLNMRQKVLKDRSLIPATINKKTCRVLNGAWNDYYYPETLHNSNSIDVDHLVPLKHAHDHGAAHWNREQKKAFSNDPQNLVITNRKYNRQKSSQGIATWLPSRIQYACRYVRDWLSVKNKYGLEINEVEKTTVKSIATSCKGLKLFATRDLERENQ